MKETVMGDIVNGVEVLPKDDGRGTGHEWFGFLGCFMRNVHGQVGTHPAMGC